MAIAQGINKTLTVKKQTGLGVPATGSGGQILRRETSQFTLEKATYENNEIAQHQQATGITHGLRSSSGNLSGVLSPDTYSTMLASLLRKAFTATTAITGASITIAGAGPYTLTRAAGSYLTDGVKIGDVIRLTAGSFNAANSNKNLIVSALTATVATVVVVNNSAMVAEGPIAAATVTIIGKKAIAPTTGQTQEYWTVEEWHNDITRSEYFTDMVMSSAELGLPSTGNATFTLTMAGLNASYGASQILTTPTAETTTPVLSAVNGILLVNNAKVGNVTSATVNIDVSAANVGGVVGSNVSPDIQRGRIRVTGQLTVFFQDGVFPGLFDAGTETQIVLVIADSSLPGSDFISVSIPNVKFSGASSDDGEKGIVKTMPFVAQLNPTGGPALSLDKTIISIQDSLAA